MLDERYGLAAAVDLNVEKFEDTKKGVSFEQGHLYCGRCGARRRMRTRVVFSRARDVHSGLSRRWHITDGDDDPKYFERILSELAPSLFHAACLQCGALFTIIVYHRADSSGGVIALPAAPLGLTTPNTPAAVTYYLDQAHRAQSVGANSAAVAMYRSALEQLLEDQGFTKRMVGPKLDQLNKAIAAGTAPKWALELDPAFLTVINQLGAGSLHANEGDITLQDEFDSDLLYVVRETFEELLDVVYEQEEVRRGRLEALEAKAAAFRTKHPTAAAESPQVPASETTAS